MDRSYDIDRPVLAFFAGALIALFGGLIGLGGAEFRLPVLIGLFALFAHRAVRFNLLVSFVTLAFAALTRVQLQQLDLLEHVNVAASMTAGGIVAAWIGAGLLARLPTARLLAIIAGLLAIVGAMLIFEGSSAHEAAAVLPADPLLRTAAGFASGLFVGAISSLLGVAGGEFIIPILMFGFGHDIKTAGTLSVLVSLPIVAAGVIRHRLTGHYRSRDVLVNLVLPMSAGSIIGAIAGGVLASHAPIAAIKLILGIVLLLSAVKLARKRAH